tara:strand:- start:7475 stop:8986 length:1512 start_codon:yes stop_codon:yes gene_type:complete
MSFSGYNLSGTVLANMKEAAGNYMPDYGSWRYKLKQPKERKEKEELIPPPEKPDEVPVVESGEVPGTPPEYGLRYIEGTEGKVGEVLTESEAYKQEAKMSNSDWEEFLANESEADKHARYRREVERGVRAAPEPGEPGYWEWYQISAGTEGYTWTGEDIAENRTSTGIPAATNTPFEKSSPMKSGLGDVHAQQRMDVATARGIFEQGFNKAKMVGSHGSEEMNNHIRAWATDLKSNVFLAPGDTEKSGKLNQQEAHNILKNGANHTKATFGEDSALAQFALADNEGLISSTITPEEMEVLGKMAYTDKSVRPVWNNDDSEMAYLVPMENGETFPVTNQWLEDTFNKRVINYDVVNEFMKTRPIIYENALAGKPDNPETRRLQLRRLINKHSKSLPSILNDEGLFAENSLMDMYLEGQQADPTSPFTSRVKDVNNNDLVMEMQKTEEGENALIDIVVDGLDNIQRSIVNRAHGEIAAKNAELQDDNGEGEKVKLSARDLLAKYS